MKMSQTQIEAVASMLTDDPDVLVNEDTVNEWWGKGPQLPPEFIKLSDATGINDVAELKNIQLELDAFARHQPTLAAKGDDAVLTAFLTYKKSGQMPNQRDTDDFDRMGGSDFRAGADRAVPRGNLRRGL
jgi:hypothetical protein